MSTRGRIIATVAALWAVAVVAITIFFVTNPVERYIGDEAHDKIIREDGISVLRETDVRPESFNTTGYLVAMGIATAVALLIILVSAIWTEDAA